MGEIDRLYREQRSQALRLRAVNERLVAENLRLRQLVDDLVAQLQEAPT